MAAAKAAFCSANSNESYWVAKTSSFLKRCGAVLEKGPLSEAIYGVLFTDYLQEAGL
jgi:hypothetical protein